MLLQVILEVFSELPAYENRRDEDRQTLVAPLEMKLVYHMSVYNNVA